MVDVFSTEKRSQIMAAIRGKGNKSTEIRFRDLLERVGVHDWTEHPPDVFGSPDFVIDEKRLVIFVDGCFWHGCQQCRNMPATNVEFWEKKISRTKSRDNEVNALLASAGWRVLRFWEHELKKKNILATTDRLMSYLGSLSDSQATEKNLTDSGTNSTS